MLIFDYEDGDFMHAISDSMAIDFDGNLMMKLSNNMVLANAPALQHEGHRL